MPALLAFLVMNKTNSYRWLIVFGGLPSLRMAQGPQRRSLAVSGARLRSWLVCDGFQTLLVSMMHSLPDSNHPAAAIPMEWQPAPATRVTLLLPGR